MSEVTRLLEAATAGDPRAAVDLLPLVYEELRKIAGARMSTERSDHTLDATALVHEAYLRLTGGQSFQSKSHFMKAASLSMRRILVDHARARLAIKRGAGRQVELDSSRLAEKSRDEQLESLDEALVRLAAEHPQHAELVQLRFFAGLTLHECSQTLGISARTADSWWSYARAWLSVAMRSD